MIKFGTSKKDITCEKTGAGMFGYGMHYHRVEGVKTRLYARAFVFLNENDQKIAVVVCDILSISISIRKEVVHRLKTKFSHLGISSDNILLTATHTHSGPGGYSHYPLYNFTIPGFIPEVFELVVSGIMDALEEANSDLKNCSMEFCKGEIPAHVKIAFNRSMSAYNRNPDNKKLEDESRHLAVDRNMYMFNFKSEKGKPVACINFFGTHATSIGSDRNLICGDNKGYASSIMEDSFSDKNDNGYVAAFAQEACGDVSPNYVFDKKRNRMRGESVDDYINAEANGQMHVDMAQELIEGKHSVQSLANPEFDCEMIFVDFSRVQVMPEYSQGKKWARTAPAALGVSFFEGCSDGYGINKLSGFMVRRMIEVVKLKEQSGVKKYDEEEKERIELKYACHGPKHILIETNERRVLGKKDLKKLSVPKWVDKTVEYMMAQYDSGSLEKTWTPRVLPLQLMIIGEIVLIIVPAEITVTAALRLKKSVLSILAPRKVKHAVAVPYSNGYSGYITTYEEYQEQLYEGGHTIFGEHTLGAFQTVFHQLALEMLKPKSDRLLDRETMPVEFSQDELARRTFDGIVK